MQKLFAGMALGVLVSRLISCDAPIADKVLPAKETDAATSIVSSSPYSTLEQSIHQQINQYRQSHKLPPLILDPRISEQARTHSQAMASGKVPFSHQGFEQRVGAIRRVIPDRAAAENVAFNKGYSNPGQQAVQGWIKSPGHRTNIEGDYSLTGIGIAKNAKGEYYFTQIFIRRLWG
jgi:uncharacterized protein YkwD